MSTVLGLALHTLVFFSISLRVKEGHKHAIFLVKIMECLLPPDPSLPPFTNFSVILKSSGINIGDRVQKIHQLIGIIL